MLERLAKTKTNRDFLDSMSSARAAYNPPVETRAVARRVVVACATAASSSFTAG